MDIHIIHFLGGVSYTIGAWFYAQKQTIFSYDMAYFIVIASLLHLIAILYFM